MATLGISTNTRLLGRAVIYQGSLVEYAMHLRKEAWSPSKADTIIAILEPCVRRYSITRIILSTPYEHHQTEAWKYLRAYLKRYCAKQKIALHFAPPEALYRFCQPEQKKTKKALMQAMVLRFPELLLYHHKEMFNRKKYYTKLFEAVAVAVQGLEP